MHPRRPVNALRALCLGAVAALGCSSPAPTTIEDKDVPRTSPDSAGRDASVTTDSPAMPFDSPGPVDGSVPGPDGGELPDASSEDVVRPLDVAPLPDLPPPTDRGTIVDPICGSTPLGNVDILFAVDNSNSMRQNQATLAAQFRVLIDQLVNPPIDPRTMRPQYPPVTSLHVGVVSSDLGTPGSVVPSCGDSDVGDDGLLNPIRQGRALRTHQPWTTAPELRPLRCMNNPEQFPSFLTFTAGMTDAAQFREEFVCNAFLSTGGCGLEQQLESVFRALVVHNPRAEAGNTDPNAGFVRNDAILAIVMITDEEDGSVRDCRYAERGVACTDALTVFDSMNTTWSSTDLNLRYYMYRPGGPQDPTWNLDRYIDPRNPARGFLSLKPRHPEQVVFGAIAGVPINLPMAGTSIDWDVLLGRNPDGSEGFVGMSAEGPVSMRQAIADTSCPTRTIPSCRREGTTYDPTHPQCLTTEQYYAWPSRRVAEVVHRFETGYRNGALSSICRNDYSSALTQIVQRIQVRLCPPG